MWKKTVTLLAMAFLAMMAVGCCPLTKLNVTVELDDAMKQRLLELSNRNIQVDIVAVNPAENQRWENYSMTKYWQPPYELKSSVQVYSMVFDPTKTTSLTLSKSDPIWDKWLANASDKGSMRLYVMALLPGTYDDLPGGTDARRQILPLGSCRWETTDVKMQVQRAGLRTVTSYKPDKGK